MFPLIAGLRTGDRRYAVFGFLGAVVGGAILGIILSFPIALVFEWLILGKRLGQDKDMQAHSEESTLV
jgi:hypothetical protein